MSSWRGPVGTIVAVTLVVDAFMWVSGMGPSVLLIATLGGLIGVLVWFVVDLGGAAAGSNGVASVVAPPPPVRADRRVIRLRTGLAYGRLDDVSMERLRDTLVDLIDDQLLAAHDVDRRDDPAGAALVLGPVLDAFVHDADAGRAESITVLARPKSLDHLVTLIERL